ncbi:MAG: HAD family hydrolase [Gaiellaceae bacterium]
MCPFAQPDRGGASTRSGIEAVLFDLGDTLFPVFWSDERLVAATARGLEALAAREDLPAPEAIDGMMRVEALPLLDPAREDEIELELAVGRSFARLGCALSPAEVAAYYDAFHAYAITFRRVPGAVLRMLDGLREQGLRLGIVSNNATPARLARAEVGPDLMPRFEAIVFSSETGKRKPHPLIYRTACERLGVEPAACFFVGDRVREDVLGPAAIGMSSALACWFRSEPSEDHVMRAERPGHVLRMVDELLS